MYSTIHQMTFSRLLTLCWQRYQVAAIGGLNTLWSFPEVARFWVEFLQLGTRKKMTVLCQCEPPLKAVLEIPTPRSDADQSTYSCRPIPSVSLTARSRGCLISTIVSWTSCPVLPYAGYVLWSRPLNASTWCTDCCTFHNPFQLVDDVGNFSYGPGTILLTSCCMGETQF